MCFDPFWSDPNQIQEASGLEVDFILSARTPQQDSTSPFFLPLNLFHSVIFRGKYGEPIRQSIKFGVTLAGRIHLFLHPFFNYSNPHVGKTLTSVVHIPKFTLVPS